MQINNKVVNAIMIVVALGLLCLCIASVMRG